MIIVHPVGTTAGGIAAAVDGQVGFVEAGFGIALGVRTAEITGVTDDRRRQEWYICDRCADYYPREKMMNQNGLNVCFGPETHNCRDEPGHAANFLYLDVPYEMRPEPLPWEDIEL